MWCYDWSWPNAPIAERRPNGRNRGIAAVGSAKLNGGKGSELSRQHPLTHVGHASLSTMFEMYSKSIDNSEQAAVTHARHAVRSNLPPICHHQGSATARLR
jgi:hypothetical protein